jgi:primosomal protein N' (replication factor Y)
MMIPDFRAGERAFRLLVQAAGRAGRGSRPGTVLVQTLMPEHPIFRALTASGGPNVEGYLLEEAQMRRDLQYPPYARMVMITFASEKEDAARQAAEHFRGALSGMENHVLILGPEPALVPRVKRRYRWRMSLRVSRQKDPNGEEMLAMLRERIFALPVPGNVLRMVDVDPLEVA